MELYSIGKLSKIVGLTPDTLRYYDEIGLLKPALISSETGYRYYTLEQAKDLAFIMELKAFDFPLAEIKKIMTQGNTQKLETIYRQRYGELMLEKERLTAAMEKLANKLKNQEEESLMNKKVLLVDDAAFMRMMLKDILMKNGFDVIGEAEDGEAGVEMYKRLNPDLVLLNITMPIMDGIAALRKIREYNPNARAVMCTAMGQSAIVLESLTAGARRFVVKPFTADKLLDEIRLTLLEEQRADSPFNRDTLEKLLVYVRNDAHGSPGGDILSQAQIDGIICLAEKPSASQQEIEDTIKKLNVIPDPTVKESSLFSGLAHNFNYAGPSTISSQREIDALLAQSPSSTDPVFTALERLAAGQEKMTELLEKLIASQGK